jgi:Domain of unknown function (DUF1906)
MPSSTVFTRRNVLQAATGLSVGLAAREVHAASARMPAPFPVVADISMNCAAELRALVALGVKVVIRYYALAYQDSMPTKRLTRSEAEAILNSGLSLVIAYQYQSGSLNTFTPERAKLDADMCLQQGLENIKQPRNSAIYFGVDGDFTDPGHLAQIVKYFEVINRLFNDARSPFKVGVYGSGMVCGELRRRQLARYFWLAGFSTNWSGASAFYNSRAWNLFQNALELEVGSIRVDTNIVNKDSAAIGSFNRRGEVDTPIENRHVFAKQLFLTRDELLLDKPDGQAIQPLRKRKMVTGISSSGSFTLIDAAFQYRTGSEDQGEIKRGYCRTDALVPIDRMPN